VGWGFFTRKKHGGQAGRQRHRLSERVSILNARFRYGFFFRVIRLYGRVDFDGRIHCRGRLRLVFEAVGMFNQYNAEEPINEQVNAVLFLFC